MKAVWLVSAALCLGVWAAGCGSEKQESQPAETGAMEMAAESHPVGEGMVQTTCPVMGGKINRAIYADHDGKRVYFCCQACVAEFEKDPEKYIRKLEDEGVVLEPAPGGAGMGEMRERGDMSQHAHEGGHE